MIDDDKDDTELDDLTGDDSFEDEEASDESDDYSLDDEAGAFGENEDLDDIVYPANGMDDKKKMALIFAVTIGVLFGLWQVVGLFRSAPAETSELDNAAVTKVEPKAPAQDLFANASPVAPVPPPKSANTVTMLDLESAPLPTKAMLPAAPVVPVTPPIELKIDDLTHNLDSVMHNLDAVNDVLNTRFRHVESGLRSVTDDLDDINRYLGHMNERVTKVNDVVQGLSDQFHSLNDTMETDRSDLAQLDTFSNPDLRVHAIIPGRAWLKKRDGSVLTVTEGDMIGEYGKVLGIDAPAAAVITSSGVTIR